MLRPARRRVAVVAATAACLLAALAACGGRPPPARVPDARGLPTWVLTPTQLDELAVDRTWEGRRSDGTAFALYTGPDRQQRLRETRDGAVVRVESGVWTLEGNASCSRWAHGGGAAGGDRKHCVVVAPGEGGYRAFNPDGSLYGTFQVREGNPHRL